MTAAIATINHSLSDMQVMAESIVRSGLFGMKSNDQALALMLVAQAEGMHPATITQDYDIIQGKACRKSHSVMARFQLTGGKVEWHELTDKMADATFSHPQGGALRMNWTLEQAAAAKLTGKDNWKNYPRAMLRSRVIAEAIRAIYPAALGGMLLAEEAQDLPLEHAIPERQMGMAEVVTPASQPTWPDNTFAERLPKWKKALVDGKTIDGVISFALTKGALTDDQLAQIKALPAQIIKEAGQRQPEGRTGPVVSYAQAADALTKAVDMHALNDAISLIMAIEDEAQAQELNAMYDKRAAALTQE